MDEIIIREAMPDDAEKIIAYTKRIGGESDNLTYGAEGLPMTVDKEIGFLNSMKENEHSVFYSAWSGSDLVGTANLSGMPRRMSHRAELGISVLKSEWNKGIGALLMQHIIDYAKAHGIEIINLEVRSDNQAAIHLYEKFGFINTGKIPAFFKIGNEYVDFDIMSLDLR
ncbi:MAG: GNAT family N-acetyltransferase [Butyrivibrio sp.]|nr:GNAT family N-acetyltransferase [Butyrivibrio sp.]